MHLFYEKVEIWSKNNCLLNSKDIFRECNNLYYFIDGNESIFQEQYAFIKLNAKNKNHPNLKDANVLAKPKAIDTEEDLKNLEDDYKAVYGILDKNKELVYIGMSMNVKKRLGGYKLELAEEKKKNTSEFLRKKIPDGEYLEFGKNYSFSILAVPPEQIVYEFEFQKKFLLSYMECKLILENTYSKGNRESYTGDRCIPLKNQKEIFAKQRSR